MYIFIADIMSNVVDLINKEPLGLILHKQTCVYFF